MTQVFLTNLADVLRADPILAPRVVEHDGWETRGRPPSTGNFMPSGILCHHTAGGRSWDDAKEIAICQAGNADAPGPITQLLVGRVGRGGIPGVSAVHVLAAGRSNHAGGAVIPWIGPNRVDGNANLIGIEASNDGIGEPWPDAQIDTYLRVAACLRKGYNWGRDRVVMHWYTGQPAQNYKIDPAGPYRLESRITGGYWAGHWDLEVWRDAVDRMLESYGGTPLPPPPPPPAPTPVPDPAVPDPPQPTPPLPTITTGDDFEMAKVIIHVDESQPEGSPLYWGFNAVWNWSGPIRSHLQSEMAVKQAVYEQTGDGTVFAAVLGDIIKNRTWVKRVGSLAGYGAVVGADPGDV